MLSDGSSGFIPPCHRVDSLSRRCLIDDRAAEVQCIMGNGTINQSYSRNTQDTTNMVLCVCLRAAVCECVLLELQAEGWCVSELSGGSARSGCVLLPAGQISAAGSRLETYPHYTAVKLYDITLWLLI